MPPNSIPSSNEFVTSTDKQQNHIDFLCDKLFSLAKNSYGGRPVNKYHTLRFAKKDKAPVTDVFLKLNIENQPYTRFLIQIILYGKYGTVAQVIQELDYIKPPEIEWLFILYNSSLVDEKEQAAKWLRNTELQFIDLFLWWEESHILSNLFCVNHL
jgi:hypothetical protein